MYEYISGKLVSKEFNSYRGTHIVVDVNGIGYLINTGKRTTEKLSVEGSNIKIYVSLNHREDYMSLTGFITKEERDIFNILQSVSGIGIKSALLILDEFSVSELLDIMMREYSKELSRAKGVGIKVAQKIILELKDKLINWSNSNPPDISDIQTEEYDKNCVTEAQSVLISLGYSANEAKNAIKEILNRKNCSHKTEDILKNALEYLSIMS